MSLNIKSGYKIIFLIGLIFGFASVFLDWYYLQGVLDSGATVMSWIYNALFGWGTPFTEGNLFNENYNPQNATMPVVIVMVLIVAVFLSAYSALFHDVEKGDNILKVKRFSFITISLVTLSGFFVLVFPLFFLLPNDLYYPFMVYYDHELKLTLYYLIGPGYWFQVISFGCTFPYALFNQSVISTFEKERYSPVEVVNSYIEKVKEQFDLDKLIAQEELEIDSSVLKRKTKTKNEMEQIYEDFLSTRRR
ncbi:MAG: hypothetical protein KGD67_06970 [Candidatus Lokiarchaeota archaeon]|nr:hypothetical protein [Candidatus Lokiarchaeota archaeon]